MNPPLTFVHLTRTIDREEKHLAKKIAAAILLCAVMVMLAAAPLAMADTHHIVKGAQGPRASAITWEYVPADYGTWYGKITNNGLRSLVVDVFDNTTGVPESVTHQRIRFAAYPTNVVETLGSVMNPTHKYEITATPNGPRDTYCDVEDVFMPATPPVAVISVTSIVSLTVSVSGSGSSDLDGTIMSYAWNFGDSATIVTGMTQTHTYALAGTYDITLVVTDNDGLTGTDVERVIVSKDLIKPVALFTATADYMTAKVDASTSYDPDGTTLAYAWAFGDTTTGAGMTATHTYALAGTYTITLTVTDADLLTDSTSHDVKAVEPIPPVASFSVKSQVALTVAVDSAGSYDPDGTIASYDWTFGDGGVATGPTATHTYAADGTYTITLKVTDNSSLSATKTLPVTVQDLPPTASFTYSVSGLRVDVDASLSSDDVGIVSWVWNWGDGTPLGNGKTAQHTYIAPAPAPRSIVSAPVVGMAVPPPYLLWGYCTDTLGAPLECTVKITNMRTGEVATTFSYPEDGYYEYDLQNGMLIQYLVGDPIKVDATSGAMTGSNTKNVPGGGSMNIDVVLTGGPQPFDRIITLTVTDTKGQSSTPVSVTVHLVP